MAVSFPSSFRVHEVQLNAGKISYASSLPFANPRILSYQDADQDTRLDKDEAVVIQWENNGGTYSDTWYYYGFTVGPNNDLVLYSNDMGTAYYFVLDTTGGQDLVGQTLQSAASVTCFLPETLIRLADNQQKQAGDLAIGDLVATPEGSQAVKFIGKTTRNIFDLRETGRMPIRIEAGALGELGPDATIHCTPSHAFHIKGSLVEAQALINGTTIQQLNDWDELMITYISIELEDHQLIYANGLLTESYYANFRSEGFSRQSWDNYAQYLELYGESESMKELDMPRIPFARQLPAELRLMLQLNESTNAIQLV